MLQKVLPIISPAIPIDVINIELTDEQVDDIVVSELKRMITIHKQFHDDPDFSLEEKEDLDPIIKTLAFYALEEEFVDFCNHIKIDHTKYL